MNKILNLIHRLLELADAHQLAYKMTQME